MQVRFCLGIDNLELKLKVCSSGIPTIDQHILKIRVYLYEFCSMKNLPLLGFCSAISAETDLVHRAVQIVSL